MNSNDLRNKIIELALLQHHKPYIHGYNGDDAFDCAGLVWFVYHEVLGLNIYEDGYGKSTTTMIMTSPKGKLILFDKEELEKDLTLIKEGDILLFHKQSLNEEKPTENNKYPGHVGIYLGDGKIIHATRKSGKVIISNLEKKPKLKEKLIGYKTML